MSEKEHLVKCALYFRNCAKNERDERKRAIFWLAAHAGIRFAREVVDCA